MSHKTSNTAHWLQANDSDSEKAHESSDDDRETSRNAATSTRATKRRRIDEDQDSHSVPQKAHAQSTGFGVIKKINNNVEEELEQQIQSSMEQIHEDNDKEDDEEDETGQDAEESEDIDDEDDDDEDGEEDEDVEDLDDYEGPPIADRNAIFTNPDKLKPLSKTQLEASKKATEKTGVIYLSRIPVCMIHTDLSRGKSTHRPI